MRLLDFAFVGVMINVVLFANMGEYKIRPYEK